MLHKNETKHSNIPLKQVFPKKNGNLTLKKIRAHNIIDIFQQN